MARPRKKYHIKTRPNKSARVRWYQIWWYEGETQRFDTTRYQRRSDAEDRIRELEEKDGSIDGRVTFGSFARDFFTEPEKCPYLAKHKNLKQRTIIDKRRNLKRIIDRFGNYRIDNILDLEFEVWLENLRYLPKKKSQKHEDMPILSGSSKNAIIETYMTVMKAAKKSRVIMYLPDIERSERESKHRDILLEDEVKTLFPPEHLDLHETWSLAADDKSGYMFGLMALVQLHGGMRPGEVRALQPFQIYQEYNTIYIIHQLDGDDQLSPLKMSNNDDKRLRFVRIPADTMFNLTKWVEAQGIAARDYIFKFDGAPIKKDYYRRRFKKILIKNDINIGDRWLTPYSLRYTFRSRLHGRVDLESIMSMMGHKSIDVSKIYYRVDPEQFKVFETYQDKIDSMW